MKILLVTPFYIPAWGFGGPVKVVSDLAQSLQNRGHQVTVATTDILDRHTRVQKTTDVLQGVRVMYFPNYSTRAAFYWNLYFPIGFQRWLKQHIKEFDVVHCHDFFTTLNITVSRVAKRAGVPYFIQPHGALIAIRQDAKFFFFKKMWQQLNPQILQNATKVIASTAIEQAEIHELQKVPLNHLCIIPNGLSKDGVGRPVIDHTVRKKYDIESKDFVILYFGRIHKIKGIDISLQSLALLKQIPWTYIIVGRDDGSQRELDILAKQLGISKRVRFVGPKFGNELAALMSISDIFLFNSRSESFPIAVLNACAVGLPVILSSECRIPEVEEYGAGVILSQNTPACTAEVVRELLQNAQRRSAMSEAGMQLLREKFSLDQIVGKYEQMYVEAIENP